MIQLKNLRDWEKVIRVLKVHWLAYVIIWLQVFTMVIISIILFFVLGFWSANLLIISISWMVFLNIIYIEWLNYELDMYVITNTRIIGIEQISFLNRNVSECNLAQVQEVNSQTKWLFANIFNYWRVSIQTAWSVAKLSMNMCPNAIEEARKILNIIEAYKEERAKKNIKEFDKNI